MIEHYTIMEETDVFSMMLVLGRPSIELGSIVRFHLCIRTL